MSEDIVDEDGNMPNMKIVSCAIYNLICFSSYSYEYFSTCYVPAGQVTTEISNVLPLQLSTDLYGRECLQHPIITGVGNS